MAVFNVSFLNPSLRKKGGTGVQSLVNNISILENELGKDGFLSSGDYDLLLDKATELRNSGALSSDQQSSLDVRISGYKKNKEVVSFTHADGERSLERINRSLKNESAEDIMMAGNNPELFLKGRTASLEAKLEDLTEMIERGQAVGADTTQQWNEYNSTLAEYSRKLEAKESIKDFDGENPIQGYVAYVTTNNNGEIVDVDYSKHGSKTGYAETNGMIDGFQVYGKTNYKRGGKNFFILGNNSFSGVDMMIPDPTNPGAFKSNTLIDEGSQMGLGSSALTRAQNVKPLNINGNDLKTQSYLPNNSWAKGANGTFYKRREDGGYTKYLNINEEDLNIDGPVLALPSILEGNIMKMSDETVDGAEAITPDQGLPMTPLNELPTGFGSPTGGSPIPTNNQQPTQEPSIKGPSQPTERASSGALATAQRTVKSGVNFFRGLFNRG